VFNGELRNSSISLRLDVPEYKNSVEFSWRTIGFSNKAVVNYKLAVSDNINGHDSTKQQHNISIPMSGIVPAHLSRFLLYPSCEQTDQRKPPLDYVNIYLNVFLYLNQTSATTITSFVHNKSEKVVFDYAATNDH
jgi:hypothetical protein